MTCHLIDPRARQAAEMYSAGNVSMRQVGKALGVNMQTVHKWLIALGVERKKPPYDRDALQAEIASLRAQLAAARNAALEEAAIVARHACLVAPDGGEPPDAGRLFAETVADAILALKTPETSDV